MEKIPGKTKKRKANTASDDMTLGREAAKAFPPEEMRRSLAAILHYCSELLERYGGALSDECKDYIVKIRQTASIKGWSDQAPVDIKSCAEDRQQVSIPAPSHLSARAVDLGEISKNIVEGLMLTKPERRIKFISAVSVLADGNEKLLRVALRNLLGHAWRNTSHKNETVIELGIAELDGEPVYFIRDNSSDFDQSEMEQALNCRDGNGEIDLRGYGLDTAAQIIRSHGGKIWVEGSDETGSVFYFTI